MKYVGNEGSIRLATARARMWCGQHLRRWDGYRWIEMVPVESCNASSILEYFGAVEPVERRIWIYIYMDEYGAIVGDIS